MKKTIVTVFSIIIVLVVMGILVNIVTGGKFLSTVGNAVATPINNAWHSVTGSDDDLIKVDQVLQEAGVDGDNDMNTLFD